MRKFPIKLTKAEAKKADEAGFWATAQYSQHLILAVMQGYKRQPDIDFLNGLFATYHFLKHNIFPEAFGKAMELKLPGIAECFQVFKDTPDDHAMTESLFMAKPKIPHKKMLKILLDAMDRAREKCFHARYAMDNELGLLCDDETYVVRAISDLTGVPAGDITMDTQVEELKLNKNDRLEKLSKMIAVDYGLEDNFLEHADLETVNDIVDVISPKN